MTGVANAVLDKEAAMSRQIRAGLIVVAVLFVLIFVWGGLAQIAGAVVSTGRVSVESTLKRIQHQEGGTIAEILVREGDAVTQGQLLARLESTVTVAKAALAEEQFIQVTARKARLETERDNLAAIRHPATLGSEAIVLRILAAEKRLFDDRRNTRAQNKAQLDEQIGQTVKQIEALSSRRVSLEAQAALVADELGRISALYRKGHVPLTRVTALQRESESLIGEAANANAAIAQSNARTAELRLQKLQVDSEARSQVLNELKEVELELAELARQRVTTRDHLRRIELRAPVSGYIQQIAHASGGVLGGGDTLMMLVPDDEPLIVEANIEPQHIDQVSPGRTANVRFTSFASATTPELQGQVDRVSADAVVDEKTGATFYTARLRIETASLPSQLRGQLIPGMQAEVHIATADRNALSYFFKPLTDQLSRTFREE